MDQIEIAIGTYENLILGYRIQEKVEGGYTLESSFTTDTHRGALRCLAVSPQGVLASTSTDDSIRLHSLKKRREVGSLFQHDGSVNCIRFFRGGHMFSASEDGTICLWKCKNWELLRLLKGHRCHVMAVAIHPSAKLGLSVGNDRTFFTWDLTTGKLAFKRKIEQVAQDILFTHDGNNYVLVYQKKIEVCSLEDTMVIQEINFESRINSVCFAEENILAVGTDDGTISIVNVITGTQVLQESFKGRLRSLCSLSTKTDTLLFLATTNGSIRVLKLDLTEGSEKLDAVLVFESGVRVTCMTTYAPPHILKEEAKAEHLRDKRKRKRRAFEANEDDETEVVEKEDSEVNDEEEDSEGNDEEEDSEVNDEEEDSEVNDEEEDSEGNDEEDDPKESDDEEQEYHNKNEEESEDEIVEEKDDDEVSDEDSEETSNKTPPKKKKKSSEKVESESPSPKKPKKQQKKLKSEDSQKKKKKKVT